MDELVQWLGEQLNEDERIAREAGGADWMPLTVPRFSSPGDRGEIEIGDAIVTVPTPDVALHIAAHDPARVLREIDAKRQLLRRYEAMAADVLVLMSGVQEILSEYRRVILPNLAAGYSDRPGFREEWGP